MRPLLLVVDDEPMLCMAVTRLASPWFDVDVAHSGAAALELCAAGRAYDLVLTDVCMPGSSGLDLLTDLRATRPWLAARVVLMTGGLASSALADAVAVCNRPVLRKPFGGEEILAVARLLLGPDWRGARGDE